jgi:hypothetical protein
MQMCKIVYFKMCGLKCVLKYNMPTKLWAKFKWGTDVPRSSVWYVTILKRKRYVCIRGY